MYLFFDTETTGLPRRHDAPPSDVSNWPRMVQLAWIYCDSGGKEIERKSSIIKPNGFIIPDVVAKIHGITTERAIAEGIDLRWALSEFSSMISISDILVAHNMNFDHGIIGAEFTREKIDNELAAIRKICTMKRSTNYCKIPSKYGYKWPNLSELYSIVFDAKFEGAHNALYDVEACCKIFFELRRRGVALL